MAKPTTDNWVSLALIALGLARQYFGEAHPGEPVPEELTDAFWINKLDQDSDGLKADVVRLAAKYGVTLPDAGTTTVAPS